MADLDAAFCLSLLPGLLSVGQNSAYHRKFQTTITPFC